MTFIPSLSQIQLEILRVAKLSSGEMLNLSLEAPIEQDEGPPSAHPQFVQELVDWGLIEVYFKHVHIGTSRFQQDSWAEYCADLSLPSIRAWELWRQEFISEQEGATHVLTPGERFGEFSEVWVEEMRFRAVQPS
ncbi:hypothetical protein [Acaryochloris marina]|uniref:Uncharacterized protein n=1 Tax=Acaryochloris marina (strain MBIC 11017) TaxID=329726 RepID=A8ZKW7_ACAM1|nr:hypothetical protein [Acaryochloris marina]ABW31435.1 hypothetical protein AM1_A0317 [Acaryochloris marina MBIC11017]BDM83494.1 hypothetical protein AM10699_63550 [Acaryochloris marina MBIC10699]